ncbi:MAG: EamA family transporter [Agathobacter sp.]|nr:EamA family transporter [Agathobacter sp.]
MNWLLYAILGVVLAGASPVFAKSGMRKSNANLAAALRGTMLFLAAWFMVGVTGSGISLSSLGQTTFIYLIFSGIATGIVWVCLLRALQLGDVIKVVPVIEGSIIIDLLIGMIVFRDAVTWNKIIILIILIAGVVMMALRSSGRGGKRGAWIGYALAAMVLTSVTVALDRIGIAGINSYSERWIRYGIALIVVWVLTFATGGYKGLRAMSFLDGVYLCISGLFMGGAWYCFFQAYILGKNSTVEIIEQFDLVAAVMLGCVFMRERTSIRSVFGMIFMMLGFILLLLDLPVIPV